MRSWSSLAGLLLSLAGHGLLALLLATVWVGEAPPLPALLVDLARLEAGENPAGDSGGVAGDPAGAHSAGPPARQVARPAARAGETERGAGLAGPPSPPPTAPLPPVSPPVAVPSPPVSPPPVAPARPAGTLAVPPEPVPMAPPPSSVAPPALAPPRTPRPPGAVAAPATPGPTPPPAAMLDVPRAGPIASDAAPREAPTESAPAGSPPDGRPRDGPVGGRRADTPTGGGLGVASEAPRPGSDGAVGGAGGGRAGAVGSGPGSGGPDAGGAPGGGALALGVPGDVAGAEYRAYYDGIRRLIRDALRYPAAARRQGLSGTVELELEVRPSGTVGAVTVVRSSSHRVLDDAALEAVRGLPRMPFPPGLQPRALRVRIPVDFELR